MHIFHRWSKWELHSIPWAYEGFANFAPERTAVRRANQRYCRRCSFTQRRWLP